MSCTRDAPRLIFSYAFSALNIPPTPIITSFSLQYAYVLLIFSLLASRVGFQLTPQVICFVFSRSSGSKNPSLCFFKFQMITPCTLCWRIISKSALNSFRFLSRGIFKNTGFVISSLSICVRRSSRRCGVVNGSPPKVFGQETLIVYISPLLYFSTIRSDCS